MGPQEWLILVGVALTVLLPTLGWGVLVHAKLAVVSAQVSRLDMKVEKLFDAQERRHCAEHSAAIGDLGRRLAWLEDQTHQQRKEN